MSTDDEIQQILNGAGTSHWLKNALTTAHERDPSRWSRHTRNWNPVEAVALKPERDVVISMAVQSASDRRVATA